MSPTENTRKIIALSAGPTVGLSATAVVLLQEPGTTSERTFIQSALRDGAQAVTTEKSKWATLAMGKVD